MDERNLKLMREAENKPLQQHDVNGWVAVTERLPDVEDYYRVRFENGIEDEKPFRIRPHKNIRGFMTEENVTHWRII